MTKFFQQQRHSLIVLLSVVFLTSCKEMPSPPIEDTTLDSLDQEVPVVESQSQVDADQSSMDPLLIPDGYVQFQKITGDLNNDGKDDQVLIIKATDPDKVVVNRFEKEVDRNRRGIVIYLSNGNDYELALENLDCFSSENEDGGVYYPPELEVTVDNNKFFIGYLHGRYGNWKYTFRLQDDRFRLIGYDSSDNYGPIVNRTTSINFLTGLKIVNENVNENTMESGDEVYEKTRSNLTKNTPVYLSEIKDFDGLDVAWL